MNIFIDDAIRKLLEMKNDGYAYCDIDLIPADEYNGEHYPPWISFTAIEDGGDSGIDYNDNEDTDVCEVPSEELEEYAYRNHQPSPNRKSIKNITISD